MKIKDMNSMIMSDQLKILYDAINNLGDGKKQAEKKQFQLNEMMEKFKILYLEKQSSEETLKQVKRQSN